MGTLEVTLHKAENLKNVELLGNQDPFCILKLGQLTAQTHTHTDGGKNPVWEQVFTFGNVGNHQTLVFELYDKNVLFRNSLIGRAEIDVREVIPHVAVETQLPVMTKSGKQKGYLFVKLHYSTAPISPVSINPITDSKTRTPSGAILPPKPTQGWRPGQWVLPQYKKTDCWADWDRKDQLGKGNFGVTFLAYHKRTKQPAAIKVIKKRRLTTEIEVLDLQREVQILHHLNGHKHVVNLIQVYEDKKDVCVVMELCSGGHLLDYIVAKRRFSERDAAQILRSVLSAVAHCHNMGVVHRDIKPENLLLTDKSPHALIKIADFGLSSFFQEGEPLNDTVGSAYFIAPEVLYRHYSKQADIWACGVLLYLLLSGRLPFTGETQQKVFDEVESKAVDLTCSPWNSRSEAAKDVVRRMLERDLRRRATPQQILQHPWMKDNGASDKPIELEVISRLKGFSRMNKLKKEALKVIACQLPVDEIAGLREMFTEFDDNKNGWITVDEFRNLLRKKGFWVSMPEVAQLMDDMDTNGDGVIDYEEFLGGMISAAKAAQEDRLKAAFEHFDKDGNGRISMQELKLALQQCKLSEAEVRTTLKDIDRNGDGEIDYYEFCTLMVNKNS